MRDSHSVVGAGKARPRQATPVAPASDTAIVGQGAGSTSDRKKAARLERTRIVERNLLQHFMRESNYRQFVITALKASIVVFCWGLVDPTLLLTWFSAGIAVVALRLRVEASHRHAAAFESLEEQAGFVRTMTPIYALDAALWAVSILLFFNRIPIYNQFGCGLIMACVVSLPLRSAVLVPRFMRTYMNTLFAVSMVCLAAASLTPYAVAHPTISAEGSELSRYLFLATPVFYWWLLRSFGTRIYANQRGQYELQYDLTQKEHEARALAEGRTRFLAAAAHDLRQPTMALSIYADQLLECPEDHLILAPRIARASSAVNHLFNSLFDLANLDSGKVVLHVEPVDIEHVLDDLRSQFEATAGAKSISLHVRSAAVTVNTDAVRLRRMVGNVLSNAIKYSPPDTKIRVVARASGGSVRVEVSDQGFGIPEADLGRVFDEFYRVERDEQRNEDGVGLGLSIVARLARLLRCEIKLQSVIGQGTRFVFVLGDLAALGGDSPHTSFGVD